MTRLLLRFLPSLFALVFILMAWGSWNFGVPPTWTQFAERAPSEVMSSTVVEGPYGNGTTKYSPTVMVTWPPGSTDTVELGNVAPEFFSYNSRGAREVAARYVPGTPITVRVFEGRPYADQIEWFKLTHASFLSLMCIVLAGIAWLFFRIFPPERQATR